MAKRIACLWQPSAQVPHRMHSGCSMRPVWTSALTGRLIGHVDVQLVHLTQADGLVVSWSAGRPSQLRRPRPRIMNGAIQQIVWQPARRPKASARLTNKPTTAKYTTYLTGSSTEIPLSVMNNGLTLR